MAQLQAFGSADQYLSGTPQITYFKQIWRRPTQFAMESIEQSWTGDVDFGKKCTISLSRAGDLVYETWLQVQLPDLSSVNHITDATPSSTQPVIHLSRHTSQGTVQVGAYTCAGATSYWASARSTTGTTITPNTGDPGLTVTFAVAPSVSVRLVPYGAGAGGATTLTLSGAGGSYTTTQELVAGVTYAVCLGDDTSSRTAVVVRQSTTEAGVSFTISDLVPTAVYTTQVSCVVAGASALSVPQHALKLKWCNSVGHALISSVEWELGGSRIDRHTSEHFDMWCELTESEGKRQGYSEMIGRYEDYNINYDATSFSEGRLLFVPLRFSFNLAPGNALPIVALQFHDCKLNFEFRSFMELVKSNIPLPAVRSEPELPQCRVFATYIFLSQEERRRFAQMPHEYLIEQLQPQLENVVGASSPDAVVNRKIPLTLSHPIKEIMFVYHASPNIARDPLNGNNWFVYDIPGRGGEEIFEEGNIQMNGHDRFVKRPAKYWRLVVPWAHHSRCPSKKVYCYSFALYEKLQTPSGLAPSGAANFSRIDSAHLNLRLNPNIDAGRLRVHALGYNVLRIANGLGGLVFVN